MIPGFLCLGGQPMPHYTVIENGKLFHRLLYQATLLIRRCHNLHLRHLLRNKRVIQAANALYVTER